MKSRIAFLLLTVLLCVSNPAGAQRAPRTTINYDNALVVQVMLLSGRELPGLVRLELFRGDIPVEEAYCNLRGAYTFFGLEDGAYAVRVSLPGFQSQYHERPLNGGGRRHLVVTLKQGDDAEWKETPPSDDPMVSVRWLEAPPKAREEITKARELRYRQDYKGAVKHAQRALEIHPSLVLAHNELGLCYVQLGMLEQARESFAAAIKLDAGFLHPYLNLADVWTQQKEFNQAGQVLLQASKAQPERGEPYYAMAKIQFQTGHLERAEQACQLALERDHSKIPGVHILLYNIYQRQGQTTKLVATLEAYLAAAPEGEHAETARTLLHKLKQEQTKTLPPPAKP